MQSLKQLWRSSLSLSNCDINWSVLLLIYGASLIIQQRWLHNGTQHNFCWQNQTLSRAFTLPMKRHKVYFTWRDRHLLWSPENLETSDAYAPNQEVEWASRMRDIGYYGELFTLSEGGRLVPKVASASMLSTVTWMSFKAWSAFASTCWRSLCLWRCTQLPSRGYNSLVKKDLMLP